VKSIHQGISDTFICKLDVNKDTNKHLTKNYTFLECKKFSQEFGGTVCSCIPQSHVHVPFIISVRSQKQQNSGIKPITHHTSLWFIKLPLPRQKSCLLRSPRPQLPLELLLEHDVMKRTKWAACLSEIRKSEKILDSFSWSWETSQFDVLTKAAVAYLKPEQSLFLCLCRSWDFGIVVGSNFAACILSTADFDLSTLIFSIITKIRNQYLWTCNVSERS